MKLVFDTNVLISASLWDNSVAHKLLINLIEKDVELFTSFEILREYEGAVIRDFKYSKEEVKKILTTLFGIFKVVEPEIKIEVVEKDPEDNKILECALFCNAEFILSYDHHLLELKEFKGMKIIKPEDFLNFL